MNDRPNHLSKSFDRERPLSDAAPPPEWRRGGYGEGQKLADFCHM
ncbi:hypothetical protein [Burkholderia ubonensis]|nr:hypothetical protein [Burkholderia ubonensis]